MNRRILRGLGISALALACSMSAAAAPMGDEAKGPGSARVTGSAIEWDLGEAVSATVTISHPDGTVTRHEFAPGEVPRIEAAGGAEGPGLPDGWYAYEIVGVARPGGVSEHFRSDAARTVPAGSFVGRGTFGVNGGALSLEIPARGRSLSESSANAAEIQKLDNQVIVANGLCIGLRCRGASFHSFISNVAQIKFITDNERPLTAWSLMSAGRSFEILAGHAVERSAEFIATFDKLGRFGINTSLPAKTLHLVSYVDIPMIRLEHYPLVGPEPPHFWDVWGARTAFIVADDTGKFPFQIRAGAPTAALAVAASGFVGMGTDFPTAKLHLLGGAGTTSQLIEETNATAAARVLLEMRNTGDTRTYFDNTGNPQSWSVGTSGSGFVLDEVNHKGAELLIAENGNVTVGGNLSVTGTISPPSSRDLKGAFAPVDAQEVLARVVAMPVTTWSYNHDEGVRHIGPVAEDFHASFGLGGSDKAIATVDSDGVALAAIQGLHQKLEDENAELRRRIQALEEDVLKLAPPLL